MADIYLGIDASWTALAICAVSSGDGKVLQEAVIRVDAKKHPNNYSRLDAIVTKFAAFLDENDPVLVAIEGYAFGATQGREMAGELGGALRTLLWKSKIPFGVIPPTVLKKIVTEKGNSKKELMILGAFKKWGYTAPNNDACDAFCLAQFALLAGDPKPTKAFAAMMTKCEWVR